MPHDSDQASTPLIVVTEVLPSEETAEDTTVNLFVFKIFKLKKNKSKMLFYVNGIRKKQTKFW